MTDLVTATAGWAPEPVETTGTTSGWTVAAVSGLFGLDPVALDGDPLPPMWHWFGFLDHPRQDQLGDDGHPAAGRFLPPVPDRRRMVAGGRLRVATPMRVGETLTRHTSLVGAQVKQGRSGEMLLVTVRHEFRRDDDLVAAEELDVVYRSQPPGQGRGIEVGAPPHTAPPTSPEAVAVYADAPLLFRFSALTYNTHRIHYDQPYVTGVEGYPGLVVHGPLLAMMLLEIPRRHRGTRAVTAFDYRLTRPAYADTHLVADHDDPANPGSDRLVVAAGVPGAPPSVTGTITLA